MGISAPVTAGTSPDVFALVSLNIPTQFVVATAELPDRRPPRQPINLWKRKLTVYLHDPPEKAYDYGSNHLKRAETHAGSFGVSDLWKAMGGSPD